MNSDNQIPKSKLLGALRGRLLAGTVAVVGLGGLFLADAGLFENRTAYADPVRVEGVEPISFADVVEQVQPAVVSVRVRSSTETASFDMPNGFPFDFQLPDGSRPFERFFRRGPDEDQEGERNLPRRRSTSQGSGFFISEDGYLVTNNHVVDDSDSVTIVMDDGTEFEAEVLGTDERTDLALLKIEPGNRELTYVSFASEPVRNGDWVVAIGNPFGLGGSVTAGIVSGTGRRIGSGPYDDFIQIDAAVNRGNSGGPAFNLHGEVIGVNTAIYSPSGGNVGIAFAIPARIVEQVIEDLRDDGAVVRGWLGVQIQPVTDQIAAGLGLDKAGGALVADPQANSPAAKVGIKAGDAILAVNGDDVQGPQDLAVKIAGYDPGSEVTITLWRDGKREDVKVTLGTLDEEPQLASLQPAPMQEEEPETSSLSDFGLTLEPSEDGNGVVISEVDPDGPAAERGISQGDIILQIGSVPVSDAEGVEKRIADARESGRPVVLMLIKSGDQVRYIDLPLSSKQG